MSGSSAYNQLEKLNLAKSIVEALFSQPARALTDTVGVKGAGVYAIYYTGDFEAYRGVSNRNADGKLGQPIYVGKAIPEGGRKGGLGKDASVGDALRSRLRIHAASISQASNLRVEDFCYRALVVDDVWIPLGENAVIEWHRPVWNVALDGFGIKEPGAGRSKQRRSEWDTVHPGRGLADRLPPNKRSASELIARVQAFLGGDKGAVSADDESPEPDESSN